MGFSEDSIDYKDNRYEIFSLASYAQKHYDSDKYSSRSNLIGLNFKVATLCFNNGDYSSAIEYYEKAYDNISFVIKYLPVAEQLKNNIKIYIALSYKKLGHTKRADGIMNEIRENSEGQEKKNFEKMYRSIK